MPQFVYALCALTSIACAFLLFRRYQSTRERLLFWSAGCFVCFAVTNVLLFIDLGMLGPDTDLSLIRNCLSLSGIVMLLTALIRETS
jgi:hypothetical protein